MTTPNPRPAIRLFEGLPEPEREAIERLLTGRRFEKGDVIFSPGDACQKVFFVGTGRVRVKRGSEGGREITLDTLDAGDSCACHPGADGLSCASYAEAVTPCTIWFMPREKYNEWVRRSPALSQALNAHLARKLRALGQIVESVTLNDSLTRLVRYLLDHATLEEDGVTVSIRLPQDQLAQEIGVTRETVARHLSSLRTARLIQTRPRRIVLTDPKALRRKTLTPGSK